MTMTDPLADMLTRIRNAQARGKAKAVTPESNLRRRVLDILQEEGYIRGYTRIEYPGNKAELEIELKYDNGAPVIRELSRVSRPGHRVYSSVADIPRVRNGLGVVILSTPQGVLSDAQARERNIGGEVLCTVF